MKNYNHLDSALIHGGIYGDALTKAVNTPIYQTSTYEQAKLGQHPEYEYSRTGNPTRAALEALIAELEGGGAGFAFASGMAAITAVLSLFSSGDSILISSNVYGGTYRVLDKVFQRFGISYLIEDTSDLEALEERIVNTRGLKAILVESPANPLLTVSDLAAVSELAKKHGLYSIVDNTFMTPYLQRPIELGADIVIHSATKYLGGHSDLIAGLVVVNSDKLAEELHFIQNSTGGILQPFDSFLLIRSIKTLGVRMDRHVENALAIAKRLDALRVENNPNFPISKVYYPGLPNDPGYEIHKRQAKNGGAMISFELASNRDYRLFFQELNMVALAESLGGVESLVCHPATMTHAAIPREIREKVGITDNLIRLSVGIEDVQDIKSDLEIAIINSGMVGQIG